MADDTPTGKRPPVSPAAFVTTTEGRQRFPDVMQDAFGPKAFTGFHRYGRPLGAVIPIDAVMVLAGYGHLLDEATLERIKNTAQALCAAEDNLPKRR